MYVYVCEVEGDQAELKRNCSALILMNDGDENGDDADDGGDGDGDSDDEMKMKMKTMTVKISNASSSTICEDYGLQFL